MSSDIHKQQLLIKASMFLTAADTVMSDDAADSDTVIDTQEQAEWEHADMMCAIHTDSNSVTEYSIHSAAMQQRDTAWDSSVSMQTTEKKTEQ